jgi:hypothetical protein
VVSINRSGDLAASAVLAAYQIAGAIDLHHNDVNNMSGERESNRMNGKNNISAAQSSNSVA